MIEDETDAAQRACLERTLLLAVFAHKLALTDVPDDAKEAAFARFPPFNDEELEKEARWMVRLLPSKHAPEDDEGEQLWTIHLSATGAIPADPETTRTIRRSLRPERPKRIWVRRPRLVKTTFASLEVDGSRRCSAISSRRTVE